MNITGTNPSPARLQMRRWIEEDYKGTEAQIVGIRWLTQEHRRAGKLASSLAIYMKDKMDLMEAHGGASQGKETVPLHRVRLG